LLRGRFCNPPPTPELGSNRHGRPTNRARLRDG
jgi:hypothetical protein